MFRQTSGRLLFYIFPAVLLYAVIAWGLWHTPNALYGMYASHDGRWAAWNAAGILDWGRFLDLSPFNPLSGMGSTFLPNLPWLNPAAAALGLPLARDLSFLCSYTIYYAELFISTLVLFRVLGVSMIRSSLAAQFYVLLLFPPVATTFDTLPWYSLAPVNAHLVALANLALALFLLLGERDNFRQNIVFSLGIVVLVTAGLFSAPVTFLTYGPVYAIVSAGFLLWKWRNTETALWRVGTIAFLAATLLLSGFVEYLSATSDISTRTIGIPKAFAAGSKLFTLEHWRPVWHLIDICAPMQTPECYRQKPFYLYLAAIVGALIQIGKGASALRVLALAILTFIALIEAYSFVQNISLLGRLHTFSPVYFLWSAYSFFALFAVMLIFAPIDLYAYFYRKRSGGARRSSRFIVSSAEGRSGSKTEISHVVSIAAAMLLIPGWALYLWMAKVGPNQPPPLPDKRPVAFLGRSSIREPLVGPIIRYLIDHASLTIGGPFRGYAAIYLGDPQGHVRQGIKFKGSGMDVTLHTEGRGYLDQHYGSTFQEMDLWEFNIPTLEEYGQWVTKQAYTFINGLFTNIGDGPGPGILHIYKLDFDSLAVLGVRFLITDLRVSDDRATLRVQQVSATAGPLYLYELSHANLGTFSPVQTLRVQTFQDAIDFFKQSGQVLADKAIVFEALPGFFEKANKMEMIAERDGYHIVAESEGASLMVLPVQFSRCFRIEPTVPETDTRSVRLFRVNGIQTGVIFEKRADFLMRFDFGLFGSTHCRVKDVRELSRLGVD